MPRYFTLEEVIALLPSLRPLLHEAQGLSRRMLALQHDVKQMAPPSVGNGHSQHAGDALEKGRQLEQMNRRLQLILATAKDLGCEVKDIDSGLVDFLAQREGKEVYLCWRMDEDTLGWWHDLDTGFQGRQPL